MTRTGKQANKFKRFDTRRASPKYGHTHCGLRLHATNNQAIWWKARNINWIIVIVPSTAVPTSPFSHYYLRISPSPAGSVTCTPIAYLQHLSQKSNVTSNHSEKRPATATHRLASLFRLRVHLLRLGNRPVYPLFSYFSWERRSLVSNAYNGLGIHTLLSTWAYAFPFYRPYLYLLGDKRF